MKIKTLIYHNLEISKCIKGTRRKNDVVTFVPSRRKNDENIDFQLFAKTVFTHTEYILANVCTR